MLFHKNPGKLRGIGKIQYPSRIIGIGLAAMVYGVNQNEWGTLNEPLNICIITAAILYPHIALFIYWKSDSNRRVETNMLLFDAFFAGVAIPFMGFNLLPSIIMGGFTAAGTMVAKGYKHFIKGIISIGIGITISCAILGFKIEMQYHHEWKLLIACCIFIVIYTSIFAFAANQFYVAIIKAKRQIKAQQQTIEEQHNDILDSINYAKRIQHAILPSDDFWNKSLEQSFVLYIPKDVVAGDFYWMRTANDTIYFAAADCTGHGVPGAMVSVVCNNGLNRSIREFGLKSPGKILDKVRELVVEELSASNEDVKDGMDIALIARQGNKIQYAGAHNPLWIIRSGAEEIEEIKANKQPIGKFDNASEFNTHELQMNPGDQIYIFSDGFADQFGGNDNKKYKSRRFKQFLLSISSTSMNDQRESLHKEFNNWKGEMEQLDDICIIGVRF